jgi:hypothetical protein
MKVRVIRHGVEQKATMKDDHYDFNYQNPILLTDPAEIWPVRDHFSNLFHTFIASSKIAASVHDFVRVKKKSQR